MHMHRFVHFHGGGSAWFFLFLFAVVAVVLICDRPDRPAKAEADQPRRLNA